MTNLQATSHFAQTLIAHLIYALALLTSTHLCTLHSPRLRPQLGPAAPAPHTPLLRLHLQPNPPAHYPASPAPWPCRRCHYGRSLHANAQMPTCSELRHQQTSQCGRQAQLLKCLLGSSTQQALAEVAFCDEAIDVLGETLFPKELAILEKLPAACVQRQPCGCSL